MAEPTAEKSDEQTVPVVEKQAELETVEAITRRMRELAAREAAESAAATAASKVSQQTPGLVAATEPSTVFVPFHSLLCIQILGLQNSFNFPSYNRILERSKNSSVFSTYEKIFYSNQRRKMGSRCMIKTQI